MSQLVRVFGPNLSRDGQRLGTLHVHAANCDHCRWYGPGTKYGGEDNGWSLNAASRREIVEDVYPPEDFDYDPVTGIGPYADDIHFSPCVALPWDEQTPEDGDAESREALYTAMEILDEGQP